MNKPGRNDQCPCGSGKKYKKCCLEKDEAEALEQNRNENLAKSEWLDDDENQEDQSKNIFLNFIDEPNFDSEDEEEDYEDDYEEDEFNDLDDDEQVENDEGKLGPEYDDYPEIGEEDFKKVELWWAKYKKLKDPGKILQYIKEFLDNNSIELSINLGLDYEALFELVADSLKAGIIDEAIEFLIYIREKYPEIYIRSAGYFDTVVITWLCIKKRNDEIGNYLNYFEEYPLEWIERLYGIIDFLLAQGIDNVLIPFTKKVCKILWYSGEVINGDTIAEIPFNEIVINYLGRENQDSDLKEMMERIQAMELDFNDRVYDPEYWQNKFEAFNKPFEIWNEEIPKKKLQFAEKIAGICDNYFRFLYQFKKLPLHVANHYASFLFKFYIAFIDQKKMPKQLFNFSEKEIDKNIVEIAKDFLGVNVSIAMTILNTLVMFSEYLEQCGNYKNEDKNELMKVCSKLHKMIYDSHKDYSYETRAFEKFPLF